jgi:hypothetical protein
MQNREELRQNRGVRSYKMAFRKIGKKIIFGKVVVFEPKYRPLGRDSEND